MILAYITSILFFLAFLFMLVAWKTEKDNAKRWRELYRSAREEAENWRKGR